jgi:hypothetical protein
MSGAGIVISGRDRTKNQTAISNTIAASSRNRRALLELIKRLIGQRISQAAKAGGGQEYQWLRV